MRDYLRRGMENNDRLMSRYADVDTGSLWDGETDVLNQSVVSANGMKIAAPDLRKRRQVQLFKALLNPKYAAFGFRTVDLMGEVSEFFENLAQIRYEMQKLRVRGLIERVQGKQLYRLTETGFQVLWLKLMSNSHFADPLITRTYRKEAARILSQPSKIEQAYDLLDQGLTLIAQELHVTKAA